MKKYFLFIGLIPTLCLADPIKVFNNSDETLYGAVYSVPKVVGQAQKKSTIITFLPKAETVLERTPFYPGYDRELVLSTNQSLFIPEFANRTAYEKTVRYTFNIGGTKGVEFYIDVKDNQILFYTKAAWARRGEIGLSTSLKIKAEELGAAAIATVSNNWIIQKANNTIDGVVTFVTEKFFEMSSQNLYLYWKSAFKNQVAHVRVDNALSLDERNALAKRLSRVQAALQKKVGPLKQVPKVALVASGGGYRAMLGTLGFLVGAEKIGLLDTITWITCLSGSTWGVANWLENNAIKGRVSIAQYRDQFLGVIQNKSIQKPLSNSDIKEIQDVLLVSSITSQPMTLVNLYGALLANRLFDDHPNRKQLLKLSDQDSLFSAGAFPIPIYTAVSGEPQQKEFYWYSYTPWEVSLDPWNKQSRAISVPVWGFGREFENGKSTGFIPELSLGFHLGTFGSAFAIDAQSVEENIKGMISSELVKLVLQTIAQSKIGQERLTWGAVHNFMRGVKESPFSKEEALRLVDGGFAFNLPYPPVSGLRNERAADVLIFLDAADKSFTPDSAPELRKVVRWAQLKGLKLPKMDLDAQIDTRSITIFESNEPGVPTVIYMPLTNDTSLHTTLSEPTYKEYESIKGFNVEECIKKVCGSLNFAYTYDQARQLSMIAEFNVLANAGMLFEALGKKAGVQPQPSIKPVGSDVPAAA